MDSEQNFDIISNLPSDVRRKLLLEYFKEPKDIFILCSTSSKYKELICNDQKLWEMLLVRDFPEAFYTAGSLNLVIKNFKNAYIRNFTRDDTFLESEAKRLARAYNLSEKRVFQDLMKFDKDREALKYPESGLYAGIFDGLDSRRERYLKQRKEVIESWKTGKKIPPPSYFPDK